MSDRSREASVNSEPRDPSAREPHDFTNRPASKAPAPAPSSTPRDQQQDRISEAASNAWAGRSTASQGLSSISFSAQHDLGVGSSFGSARQALQNPSLSAFDSSALPWIGNGVSTSTEASTVQPSINILGAVDTTSNLFADFDQQLDQYLPVTQTSTGFKSQQGQYSELSSLAAAQNRTIFPAGPGNVLSNSQQGLEPPLTGHVVPGVDVAGNGSMSWADMGISGTNMAQTTPSPPASLFDPANGMSVTSTLRLKNSEDLAEWVDICFFLSLHTRHQHALVPLVHQPSFAQDVLHRRDQRDESFRCLLISLVAYTICQCPVNQLLSRMDRTALEALLRRCQRASRMIQIRHQMKPSLNILASTMLDWITGQATTSIELSDNLMGDIRRLVYGLNLHHATPRKDMSRVELEICRRLFWEAYVIDKTHALNGHPMAINDSDGLPPMCAEIDDEMMICGADVIVPQPAGRVSYMTGFVVIARLFVLISRCLRRHRTITTDDPMAGPNKATLISWTSQAKESLDKLLADLPPELHSDFKSPGDENLPYGMQAANIIITALCLDFALLDLKASLIPEQDLTAERNTIAQRALKGLESIPIRCLALNGESMRGKVVRVVLALLNTSKGSNEMNESVWGWWNMYSRIQFLQIIPEDGAPVVVPTRPQSPQ